MTTARQVDSLTIAKLHGRAAKMKTVREKIVALEDKRVIHAEVTAQQRPLAQQQIEAINNILALHAELARQPEALLEQDLIRVPQRYVLTPTQRFKLVRKLKQIASRAKTKRL